VNAQTYLGFDGHPSELYLRTVNTPAATTAVDTLLAAQADPEYPNEVNVSQPSQALTAQADAAGAFDTLFLGLGAVALLVGAVGVANIMIIWSWSAARKSGCAARWAPPRARSGSSSWPRQSCWPWPVGPPGTPPSAPPACHPLRHSGPCDRLDMGLLPHDVILA
jgi:hypothetical protein